MARPLKNPLRALSETERTELNALAHSRSAPADRIARAKQILAVADGANLQQAARQANRHSRQALAKLIRRFNHEGMGAIDGHHGGGPALRYGPQEQARILQEFVRPPDREQDQTATWSLTTLQRALRRAPDGLPTLSTYVIFQVLHQAGYTWQENRTWCDTGTVERKRKEGIVTVTDPRTVEKRGPSSRRTREANRRAFPSGPKMRPVRIRPSRNRDRPGNPKATQTIGPRSIFGAERPSC